MAKRHYTLELTVKGFVHIGNGETLGKKDYFQSNGKIAILDVKKFVANLTPEQLKDYCEYLATPPERRDDKDNLQIYLKQHNLLGAAAKSIAYVVESPLATARRGAIQYHDVFKFVKDPYGNPYIPGSSVKGMLRTALLNVLALDNKSLSEKYDAQLSCSKNRRDQGKAAKSLEKAAFWLEQPDKNDAHTLNDIMKYVSVSDSKPLSTSDLAFVKKFDKFSRADDCSHKLAMGELTDAEGNELNIYRECLRPGTKITVAVDIDSRIDDYLPFALDKNALEQIFTRTYEVYKKYFLDYFDAEEESASTAASNDGICQYIIASGPFAGKRCRNHAVDGTPFCKSHQQQASEPLATATAQELTCYLGGGVDFDSKTVLNALFGNEQKRLPEMAHILYTQFPTRIDRSYHNKLANEIEDAGYFVKDMRASYNKNGKLTKAKEDHRHWRDVELGVAPHTMKFGLMDKEKLPMGKCSISIKELGEE